MPAIAWAILKSRWLHYGLMALAIWGAWQRGDAWKSKADDLKEYKVRVTLVTRDAADRPKLSAENVPMQIAYMGDAIKQVRAAQAKARADAMAAKEDADRRNRQNKDRSDEEYKAVLPDARRKSGDYARANRVRRPKPRGAQAGSAAGVTDLPAVAFGSGSVETASPETDMVAISRADFDICTINTVRLEIGVDWVNEMEGGKVLVSPGTAQSPHTQRLQSDGAPD